MAADAAAGKPCQRGARTRRQLVRRSGAPPVGVAGEQLGEQVGKILYALGAHRPMLGVAALPEGARRLQAALPHVPGARVGSVPSSMSAAIVRSHSARRLETIRQARIMSGSGAAARAGDEAAGGAEPIHPTTSSRQTRSMRKRLPGSWTIVASLVESASLAVMMDDTRTACLMPSWSWNTRVEPRRSISAAVRPFFPIRTFRRRIIR